MELGKKFSFPVKPEVQKNIIGHKDYTDYP